MVPILFNLASAPAVPPIIPAPANFESRAGTFSIQPDTVIVAGSLEESEAQKFATELRTLTGFKLPIQPRRPGGNYIVFETKSELNWLTPEGYRLTARPTYISIRSSSKSGLFYGGQSLIQMLPPVTGSGWTIPAGEVTDRPNFGWRGLMLDESRHFFGVDQVKRLLDVMALYKFNRFHWHLVDDGGWRIEIKSKPLLTEIGAWRVGGSAWDPMNMRFARPDGESPRYGGFYTQEEIKGIVEYARQRHIEIVPEIEIPGHNLAAISAYPELGCDPDAVKPFIGGAGVGAANTFCPGREESYTFLRDVLDEVMQLFPSQVIHLGGDEVDRRAWAHCKPCLSRQTSERIGSREEFQNWFMSRISRHIQESGRTAIGWDEVMEGGGVDNCAVMSWRGIEGAIAAARSGRSAVMSPTSHCYFDYSYAVTPVQKVYSFNPIPPGLTPAQERLILGGQGNTWTEWIETREKLERQMFPRALALSEALWSPPERKEWSDFRRRLEFAEKRFEVMGIGWYPGEEAETPLIGSQVQSSAHPPYTFVAFPALFALGGRLRKVQTR